MPSAIRHAPALPLKVFISYSHADEEHRAQLVEHLAPWVHTGRLQLWFDRKIPLGSDWGREIAENLETSDLVILLVTPDFLASSYCWDVELRRALARHEEGRTRVIPLFVKPTALSGVPYQHLQGFPRDKQSRPQTITGWPEGMDSAYVAFVEQLGLDDPWRHELFVLLARPDVDLSLFLSRQLDTLEQVLAPSASVPVRDTSVLGAFTFEIRLALLERLIESAALPATDENVVRMGPLSRPPLRTQANTSTAKVLLEQPRESPLAPSSPSSAPASPQPGAPCSPPPPPLGGAGRLMAHPHNTCYGVT